MQTTCKDCVYYANNICARDGEDLMERAKRCNLEPCLDFIDRDTEDQKLRIIKANLLWDDYLID